MYLIWYYTFFFPFLPLTLILNSVESFARFFSFIWKYYLSSHLLKRHSLHCCIISLKSYTTPTSVFGLTFATPSTVVIVSINYSMLSCISSPYTYNSSVVVALTPDSTISTSVISLHYSRSLHFSVSSSFTTPSTVVWLSSKYSSTIVLELS